MNSIKIRGRIGLTVATGIATLAIAALSAPLVGAASAITTIAPNTSLSFTSDKGDYIGQGGSQVFTPPGAKVILYNMGGPYTAPATLKGLTLMASQGSDWWYVELAPAPGKVLAPGVYNHVQRAAFRTAGHAGLDVYGDGRGCSTVGGNFTINQIKTNAAGTVTLLDASFNQICEPNGTGNQPEMHGTVEFSSLPLTYQFASDKGDWVGGGQSAVLTGANANITMRSMYGWTAQPNVKTGFEIDVNNATDNWTIEVAPVAGKTLGVGIYTGAQRAAFRAKGHPGLDVYGDGRGCNTVAGTFTITGINADNSGNIKAVAGTFEQHCEGMAPALHGLFAAHS